jgi:glycosyltransferase involved in cell wall biosynthesis
VRVVLLVTDLQRGGTPLRLAGLARGMKAAGVEIAVGCLASPGPVSDELESASIPTFACGARSAHDVFVFRRLAKHLRRIKPELIHATLTHANVAARVVGRWLSIPVVTSTATIEVERRWHRTLERWTASLDRGHIVNSQALADHVAARFHVARERIHVVPPSIDAVPARTDRATARARFEVPPNAFVVLWAGRLDPVKRLELVVACAELLSEPLTHVLLAGDGPARRRVQDLVEHSPARQRLHLLGWQSELGPAMSAADVFLFPSRTEGMPNALLQAMAFGLPVIGSDIPALRELAGHEERILLVNEPGPEAYVTALRRLHEDDALRETLAQRAADWARTYLDPRATVRATLAAYERVLAIPKA